MAHADSDRNLLFGLLAVQMDFISRDDLFAAMQEWAFDKGRPIGQILVERQALDADERGLIDALVAKHLARHGDDPARSLAAVSSVTTACGDLKRIDDPDLQASLAHIPETRDPRDPDATKTWTVGASTSAGTRFRILRPHARGGLGEVFVAHDNELNREVALKEIQAHHAHHAESRSRFVLEAEVTGGLEHPNIVPVYGLGSYDDGRPYYAMRFIRGDSLKDAIARFHAADKAPGRDPGERGLALRKLLGRLIDVCNAMAYAHSRGVLHRDIKPDNVMLGKVRRDPGRRLGTGQAGRAGGRVGRRGEERTLRPSSTSGSQETLPGSAVGTPAYMSPEQAAGDLARLGPASDVYSLGATLYCLLTGKAPFEGREIGLLLQRVQRGEFPPPRAIRADIQGALEVICLKAMATRPEGRYATPRGLADDIEHWLADEPVSAWREPFSTRARRWMARHRAPVAAAAALVLTATVGLTFGTILLAQANDRTEKQKLKVSQQLAKTQAAEVEARLAAAESRTINEFLTKDLLGQASPELNPRQAKVTVEEVLDRAAATIGGRFARQPRVEATIRTAIGRTYLNLGELEKAEPHLVAALEVRHRVLGLDHPDTLDSTNDLASLLQDQGKYGEVEALYRRVLDARRRALGPDHPDTLKSIANLGQLLFLRGELAEGELLCRHSLEALRRGLGPDHPETLDSTHNLVWMLREQGKLSEAEPLGRRLLEANRRVRGPEDPDTLWSIDTLASVLLVRGKLDEAEPLFRIALRRVAACWARIIQEQ